MIPEGEETHSHESSRVSRGVVTGQTVVPLVQPQSSQVHLTTASLVLVCLVCLVCLAPELDRKLTHARTI